MIPSTKFWEGYCGDFRCGGGEEDGYGGGKFGYYFIFIQILLTGLVRLTFGLNVGNGYQFVGWIRLGRVVGLLGFGLSLDQNIDVWTWICISSSVNV